MTGLPTTDDSTHPAEKLVDFVLSLQSRDLLSSCILSPKQTWSGRGMKQRPCEVGIFEIGSNQSYLLALI